jgi:hypothetical protein
MMAVHVCDWHYLPENASPAKKEQFGQDFPDWKVLRAIANGTKHPGAKHKNDPSKLLYPRPDREPRVPEWEDTDFWFAYHGSEVARGPRP